MLRHYSTEIPVYQDMPDGPTPEPRTPLLGPPYGVGALSRSSSLADIHFMINHMDLLGHICAAYVYVWLSDGYGKQLAIRL